MELSPRERIIRVLKREGDLDRIPWSFHFGASSAFTPGSYKKGSWKRVGREGGC